MPGKQKKKHPSRKGTATLKGIMFGYQAHAQRHLGIKLGKFTGCLGHPPNQDDYERAVCPICLTEREYEDLSIEHVPQQGGQSSLGPFTCKVLTCRDGCNNNANDRYEQPVEIENHRIVEHPADLAGFDQCLIHGARGWRSEQGLIIPPNDNLRFVVDLKSGFLLAFAALGYRWAATPELEPVREAIRIGRRPGNQYAVMAKFGPSEKSVVMDVARPFRSTIVRHKDGTALILPTVGAPAVPITYQQMLRRQFEFGPVKAMEFPWPARPETKRDVRELFERSHLFHIDHCDKHAPGYY